jgi:D-alanine-D-alanine ligase
MTETIFLLSDIYPKSSEGSKELFQEWESRETIGYLSEALVSMGYRVEVFEPMKNKAHLLDRISNVVKQNQRSETILWNLVEGFFSRNRESYIPNLGEFLGIPYTGSDGYAQAITLNKDLTKSIARSIGIPTPKSFLCISRGEVPRLEKENFPLFAKPNQEGSSLGVFSNSLCYNFADLKQYIDRSPNTYFPILLEEYLPGDEFTLGILGTTQDLRTLRLLSVQVDGIYGQDSKGKGIMSEKITPLPISSFPEISDHSLKLASYLGFFGYGRADWKLDFKGNPQFLELNLTPGLSPFYSSFPISYGEGKGSYQKMVEEILQISRWEYEGSSRLYGRDRLI